MQHISKTRDYLFDNYKALLIVLVVLGHFAEPCYENNSFLLTLKWLIFSFHMPAFIVISGYFSKRHATAGALIKKLIVPYLVFEIFYYLIYTCLLHKDTGLYLLYPKFSLWYLLALFIWRLVTPYVKKIPHCFLLAFAAGLAAGFLPIPGNFLSVARVLVFYPYFLAGTMLDRSLITHIRKSWFRTAAAVGSAAYILFLAWGPLTGQYPVKIFYGRYGYEAMGQEPLEGILVRLLCYGIGFFLTFAGFALLSEKKHWFSFLGVSTMSVYLFHGLIYQLIRGGSEILYTIESIPQSLALMGFCVILSLLLAHPYLCRFTEQISRVSLVGILQKIRPQFDRECLLPGVSAQRFRRHKSWYQ